MNSQNHQVFDPFSIELVEATENRFRQQFGRVKLVKKSMIGSDLDLTTVSYVNCEQYLLCVWGQLINYACVEVLSRQTF